MAEVLCPFCGFKSNGEYAIQLHIEEHHTDGSAFTVKDATPPPLPKRPGSDYISGREQNFWTRCTRPGCGEYVLLMDVDEHLEMHEIMAAVNMGQQNERPKQNERSPSRESFNGLSTLASERDSTAWRSPQKPQKHSLPARSNDAPGRSLLEYFSGTSHHGKAPPLPQRRKLPEPRQCGRLGKRELGPHAFEKQMPNEVRRHLLNDAAPRREQRLGRDGRLVQAISVDNETSGVIPVLADLCSLDDSTEKTYFCDPSVKHVSKLRCDGNFCGYWNIQMLMTYLQRGTDKPVPDVLQIQDTIEQAWNSGICSYGRVETGGILGTRKWIGTHEAVAHFTKIGVGVEALSFLEDENDAAGYRPSVVKLLDHIDAYFISTETSQTSRNSGTSQITTLPPIYFQRRGHSMTAVGLERKKDGSRNLLVFDPSFATTDAMVKILDGRNARVAPEALLRPYRRSEVSLSRWDEFEIVVPQGKTR